MTTSTPTPAAVRESFSFNESTAKLKEVLQLVSIEEILSRFMYLLKIRCLPCPKFCQSASERRPRRDVFFYRRKPIYAH